MTFLRTFVFALLAVVAAVPVGAKSPKQVINQDITEFALTSFLETQAAVNTHQLAKSVSEELAKTLKTPKAPTKSQLKAQAFQDWFCRFKGSPLRKMAQVGSCIVLLPVAAVAWARAALTTDYTKLTIAEQTSYAAFSLGALAVQTYITERAGINSSKPLLVKDILELVKDAARKHAQEPTKIVIQREQPAAVDVTNSLESDELWDESDEASSEEREELRTLLKQLVQEENKRLNAKKAAAQAQQKRAAADAKKFRNTPKSLGEFLA